MRSLRRLADRWSAVALAWAVLAACRAVRALPVRFAYRLAGWIGVAAYYLWPRGRRAMRRNYRRILTDPRPGEVDRVARASLANYCRYLVDFARFPMLTSERALALTEASAAVARMDAERAAGRGIVIISIHFGNWDLGAAAAAAHGYPLSVIAETFANERLDRFVVASRERLGMRVLKMEKAGPSMARRLIRGECLALLMDRPDLTDGVPVPFFGRDVTFPGGPARLALRTGAVPMPVVFVRDRPNGEAIRVIADFDAVPQPTGDVEHDVVALTAVLAAAHERFIRRWPDQWYMFRDMWPDR